MSEITALVKYLIYRNNKARDFRDILIRICCSGDANTTPMRLDSGHIQKVEEMSRFHIIEHPLVAHKMSVLRDKETKTPLFRQTLREVAYLMTFAVTQHLDMVAVRIDTPLEVADCHQLKHIILSDDIKTFGIYAFENCRNLV